MDTEVVGPVFTRIWDRPGSVFAERSEARHRARIQNRHDEPDRRLPQYAGRGRPVGVRGRRRRGFHLRDDQPSPGTSAVHRTDCRPGADAGVSHRRPAADGVSNPESARYDSTYQSTFGYSRAVDVSPLALTARVSPSFALDANLRLEYDMTGAGLALLSAGGSVNGRSTSVSLNYSKRSADDSDFLSAATTMRWLDGRATGTYALSWDIGRAYIVSQSIDRLVPGTVLRTPGRTPEVQLPRVVGNPDRFGHTLQFRVHPRGAGDVLEFLRRVWRPAVTVVKGMILNGGKCT